MTEDEKIADGMGAVLGVPESLERQRQREAQAQQTATLLMFGGGLAFLFLVASRKGKAAR